MTARLPGFAKRGLGEVEKEVSEARLDATGVSMPSITLGMVDEAVEKVVRDQELDADLASVLMFNLGKDPRSGVANAYYSSRAASRMASVGVKRHDVNVRYVMSDADVAALVDYAPEFRLMFSNSESHDHAVAAACRLVDHRLIMARVPYGASVTDVGGNPLVHIKAGSTHVHVCGPVEDNKDQMRHKLRAMEARKIAKDTTKPVSACLAQRYLDGDSRTAVVTHCSD